MTKRITTTACLLGVAACGGSPTPGPETAPAATVESTAASAVASPPSAVASVTPSSPPTPPSPFKVIGALHEVRLFGVGERGFVADQSGIVYSLVGDEVIQDPLLQRGFSEDPMFSLESIAGSWPDGAWLATTHPSGRSGFTKLWKWDGKRWVNRHRTTETRFIAGIRPWTGGRELAVEQAFMMFDATFRVISGDKNVVLPAFTKRKNAQSFCRTELMVQAFDTLPSGDVVTAGQRCNDETVVGLGVERWAQGAKKGTIDTLPGTKDIQDSNTSLTITGMAVLSPTDVYVSAVREIWNESSKDHTRTTYLAHFEGSGWKETQSKIPGVIEALSTSGDRKLLVTNDRGELYTGASFEALTPMPLPKELSKGDLVPRVTSLWSPAPGDLWAVANMVSSTSTGPDRVTGQYYLLHTRPGTKPLPTGEEFAQRERAFRIPGPPIEGCVTPFVLLYTLGKKAPADYDYPSTRTALRGHKEFSVEGVEFIEFERMGSRFFGARVPDFALGRKLATLVKEKVPGSTPELVCHDPPVLRTLAVEL